MYGWEISIRGGGVVMKSDMSFLSYEDAKEDLKKNINGEFQKVRMMSLKYNYTIFDMKSMLDKSLWK